MPSKEYIRRYTNLASCLDIIKNGRLTLLSPKSWDDGNDREYLETFRKKAELSAVYALCFTEAVETYHHWKVFSSDVHGVCIYFNKRAFIKAFEKDTDIQFQKIRYKHLSTIQRTGVKPADMPFTKLYAYRGEEERRLLGTEKAKKPPAVKTVPLDLGLVEKIQLSPWLPDALVAPLKEAIRTAASPHCIRVTKSKVVENPDWLKHTSA